ncbi:hypothetical protein GGF32_006329 [Allomyces javanicus]|nr:hypothetical protein GGF32_006329 [Allomyces javanicus]
MAKRDAAATGLFAHLPSLCDLRINRYGTVLNNGAATALLEGADVARLEMRDSAITTKAVHFLADTMPRLRFLDVAGCKKIVVPEIREIMREEHKKRKRPLLVRHEAARDTAANV